ncbi:MAG TPA: SpoIIE family protein phosphatase [Acidobacteriaceae bacterium]
MRSFPCRSFGALLSMVLLVSFHARASAPAAPVRVIIGNPIVALTGPWRFHPGDDLAWAQPDFDDASWSAMDLASSGSLDPTTGVAGFVRGWTSNGYPKLTGYAWYRLQVDVESGSGNTIPPLAIRMPEDVDDAYQVYVDGRFIGEFGNFAPHGVSFINAQPRAFPLPPHLHSGPITIAVRAWMDTATPFMAPDAGGLHEAPLLGQAQSVDTMLQMDWQQIDRSIATYVVRCIVLGLLALLAFVLFWLDRREKACFWLALACSAYVLNLVVIGAGYYVTWIPMVQETIVTDILLNPIQFGLWVIFWASWFRLPEMRRIHSIVWPLVAFLVAGVAMLRAPLYGAVVPVSASAWLLPLTEILKLAFGAVLFWIAYRGIRTRGIEGWLALIPILLMPVWLYTDELATLHIYRTFYIHGIPVRPNTFGLVFMMIAVSLLMLRRFISGLRDKQRMETEMEQARQVQQVLIPEALPVIPGFQIQSEYRPARQVGGDFFQIIALDNHSFLAVIGDVSGKGIPAAMTVSLLVGAVRTALLATHSPAALLGVLNARMIGRSQGGFTTCLIIRVEADGAVTAANAGHLAPYLNGREIPVANGLPLGLSATASYAESAFRLSHGDRLTLITDGVTEARSRTGELFGFERAATIANQPAADIAAAAERFGMEDDITVLGVLRLAAEPSSTLHDSELLPA